MVRSSYALAILRTQPVRLVLTAGGLGLCIVLMLFLLGVRSGVEEGSVDYIRGQQADLWVLRENSWNILRGTSLLSTGHGVLLRDVRGVAAVSPVLELLPGITRGEGAVSIFLMGHDPAAPDGAPPRLASGRRIRTDDEIVLDVAFAEKYGIGTGDTVEIRQERLRVVGLSAGTNAVVIQYAFVSLRRAQDLIGVPGLVTAYLVRVEEGYSPPQVAAAIAEAIPGLAVFDHETFVRNNLREMESGLLPFLATIAAIAAVMLTAILSLLITIGILEQRKEFALVKTLGAPPGFLPRLVVLQTLALTGLGCGVAVALFPILSAVVRMLTPELSLLTSFRDAAAVVGAAMVIAIASSAFALRRLRTVYSLEAFT